MTLVLNAPCVDTSEPTARERMKIDSLRLEDLPAAVEHFRKHKATHVNGFDCTCGDVDDETNLEYPNLQDEYQAILALLKTVENEVVAIAEHRCDFRISDCGEFYHKCSICGADGNA